MAVRKKSRTSLRGQVMRRIKEKDAAERAAGVRKAKSVKPVHFKKAQPRMSGNRNTEWMLREQERRAAGQTPRPTRRRKKR